MSLGPMNLGIGTPSKTPSAYVVRTHKGESNPLDHWAMVHEHIPL